MERLGLLTTCLWLGGGFRCVFSCLLLFTAGAPDCLCVRAAYAMTADGEGRQQWEAETRHRGIEGGWRWSLRCQRRIRSRVDRSFRLGTHPEGESYPSSLRSQTGTRQPLLHTVRPAATHNSLPRQRAFKNCSHRAVPDFQIIVSFQGTPWGGEGHPHSQRCESLPQSSFRHLAGVSSLSLSLPPSSPARVPVSPAPSLLVGPPLSFEGSGAAPPP